MPLYEYRCASCDHLFEELVSGRDEAVSCPRCKKRKVTRQLSTFAARGSVRAAGPCGERCDDGGGCDVPAKTGTGGGCCGGACCH